MVEYLDHGVSELQFEQLVVEWVPYSKIRPNKYNPNRMTWNDRMLLRQSLLEDGWTQPIVTLPDGTIVDGEQRWTVAGMQISTEVIQDVMDKIEARRGEGYTVSDSIITRLNTGMSRIAAAEEASEKFITLATLTNGYVPITKVDFQDEAHQMISTIRHNRATGTHVTDAMVAITNDLVQLGLDFQDLEQRLGMPHEEAERLLAQVEVPNALKLTDEFSMSWVPVHIGEIAPDHPAVEDIEKSQKVNEQAREYNTQLRERELKLQELIAGETERRELERGTPLTQVDKAEVSTWAKQMVPAPPPIKTNAIKKFVLFLDGDEYAMIESVLLTYGETLVQGLVALCQSEADRIQHAQKEKDTGT